MTGLLEFIKARLYEEERDAREALTWEDDRFTGHAYMWMHVAYLRGKVKRQHVIPDALSPRAVLAEVDAKRRIVAYVERELADLGGGNPYWYDDKMWPIVRMLALPYAGHRDYDEGWRP